VTRFGFLAFFAFFLLLERLLREVERLRLARRFLLDERFLILLRGARGLLAVLRRDFERDLLVDLFAPLGVALRRARFFEDRLLDRERDREVDIEREREREVEAERDLEEEAALGLLAVRRFLELRERLLEREVDAERDELLFGALGAAARRRRAFLALRFEALLLDFFGARGLLAVRRRDLERDFLGPLGVALRRRRLVDLERERLELRFGALARFADRPDDALRSRFPVILSRATFCSALYASFSAIYFL